jgi:RNA polymerase sigma-70 factor (ECF subfamily)
VSTDRELVRRVLAGEPAATRELVARFEHDVFGLCVRLLRHRHDAEDVAQDVFLRVFRGLRTWDPTRPLRPWVLTVAVNRCRTHLSRRKARPDTADYLADLPDSGAPVSEQGAELAAGIAEAVGGLRDDYREVFVLFHETGQSYEEIAAVVGRPVGTVKTWLHRARASVLDHLKKLGLAPEAAAKPAGG